VSGRGEGRERGKTFRDNEREREKVRVAKSWRKGWKEGDGGNEMDRKKGSKEEETVVKERRKFAIKRQRYKQIDR
jgi:hypothetical protein